MSTFRPLSSGEQDVGLLAGPESYMVYLIIMSREIRCMEQQEKIMLIVELNVVGYRLSGEWAGLRRTTLRPSRFNPRTLHWRMPQLRQTPAA